MTKNAFNAIGIKENVYCKKVGNSNSSAIKDIFICVLNRFEIMIKKKDKEKKKRLIAMYVVFSADKIFINPPYKIG